MVIVVLLALIVVALTCGALATFAFRRVPRSIPASPRATAAVVRHELETKSRRARVCAGRVDPTVATGLPAHVGSRDRPRRHLLLRRAVLDDPSQRRTRAARPRSRDMGRGQRDRSLDVGAARDHPAREHARRHRGRGRGRADRVPARARSHAAGVLGARDRRAERHLQRGEGPRRPGPSRHPSARARSPVRRSRAGTRRRPRRPTRRARC